jgi:hypothetical protein
MIGHGAVGRSAGQGVLRELSMLWVKQWGAD